MTNDQTDLKEGDSADESSENHTGDEGSAGTPDNSGARRSAKRRIIDETLLDEDEARKLESRRAYNRKCAAKARKRSKDLISQLQDEVQQLHQDKTRLERTNEVMQAQLKLLEQQNQTLMINQRQNESLLLSGMSGGGLMRSLPQGPTGLSAAALLDSLSQRDRIIANQIISNGYLSQQFPGGAGDEASSRGLILTSGFISTSNRNEERCLYIRQDNVILP